MEKNSHNIDSFKYTVIQLLSFLVKNNANSCRIRALFASKVIEIECSSCQSSTQYQILMMGYIILQSMPYVGRNHQKAYDMVDYTS